MKKLVYVVLCLVIACAFLCACKTKSITVITEDDNKVVLTFDSGFSGESLLIAMNGAQENEQITFTVENGMVTSINGVKNAGKTYWMLYTDDEDYSNSAWGEINYNEKIYGSATKGVSDLVVKDGKTYIWVFKEVNF